MLFRTRRLRIPDLGASTFRRTIYHSDYRFELVRHEGRLTDGALVSHTRGHRRAAGRSQVSVVLSGRALVRAFGRDAELGPGDAVVLGDAQSLVSRNDPCGGEFVCVDFEWTPGSVGPAAATGMQIARLGPRVVRTCATLLEGFDESTDAPAAARSVGGVLECLRGAGFAFDRVTAADLVEDVPAASRNLAIAMDRALNAIPGATAVDLERLLGITERQVRRLIDAYVARFQPRGGRTWREMRNEIRVNEAAFMMTAEGARTETIARAFGYSSPTALCLAFANTGLPSPGKVRERVRELW